MNLVTQNIINKKFKEKRKRSRTKLKKERIAENIVTRN